MENKITYELPEEIVSEAVNHIDEIVTLLKPYLIALTPDERKVLPKMSDGTSPFVYKCLDYLNSDPEFASPFTDQTEFGKDMLSWERLMQIIRPLQQLTTDLDDTIMEAGAESYTAALGYYRTVKMAAEISVPGAKGIYNDLKTQFAKSSPSKEVAQD